MSGDNTTMRARGLSVTGELARMQRLKPVAFAKMALIQRELATIERQLALLQASSEADDTNAPLSVTASSGGGGGADDTASTSNRHCSVDNNDEGSSSDAHLATTAATTAALPASPVDAAAAAPPAAVALNDLLISPDMAPLLHVELCQMTASGDAAVVRTLLEAGANANERDYDDRTLLHIAAMQGHVSVAQTLLELGADATLVDRDGCTALEVAERQGQAAVAALLRAHMARYAYATPPDSSATYADAPTIDGGASTHGTSPTTTTATTTTSASPASPLSPHVPDYSSVPQPMTGSLIVIMMGLPGRGKTYVAQQIRRYFQWNGLPCAIYSHQAYRKRVSTAMASSSTTATATAAVDEAKLSASAATAAAVVVGSRDDVLQAQQATSSPSTSSASAATSSTMVVAPATAATTATAGVRDIEHEVAALLAEDMTRYVTRAGGVAILDGTQSTPARRHAILHAIKQTRRIKSTRVIVVEIVNNDRAAILRNITRAKELYANAPDNFVELYWQLMAQHEAVYRTLSPATDGAVSYIRLDGRDTSLNMISGWMPSRLAYMLHNLCQSPKNLYLTRPGEYADMVTGVIGGNSRLTPRGEAYAEALYDYFTREVAAPGALAVMSSCAKRCVQTVQHFALAQQQRQQQQRQCRQQQQQQQQQDQAEPQHEAPLLTCRVNYFPTLDDINHGDCEGLRLVDVLRTMPSTLQAINADPYNTAWPNGECLHQVYNARLEPHIHDIQASTVPVLVASHLPLLQGLYACFVTSEDTAVAPQHAYKIDIPYECVVKIHMVGFHRVAEMVDLSAQVNQLLLQRTGDFSGCARQPRRYNMYKRLWHTTASSSSSPATATHEHDEHSRAYAQREAHKSSP